MTQSPFKGPPPHAGLGLDHKTQQPLGSRDREILKDIIRTYILSAEPVSSRTVARQGRHGVSAATIRNVMADLEEWGYLMQPHSSAGRVPTREGYHLFINALMENRELPGKDRRAIDEGLASVPAETQQLLAACLVLLKDMAHQVSLVLTPAMGETVLKAIEFVLISERQVLCVVVSSGGFVDNKVIATEEPLTREELTWISNFLTEHYGGRTLREIREQLLRLMAEDRAQVDRLLALSIDLAQKGLEDQAGHELMFDGTHEVLHQPELADISRVRQLFDTFSRKAKLVSLLNQAIGGEGVRVVIGDDSDLTSQLDFSLVTTHYGRGAQRLGTIGVFGPSRMEYSRIIPLVHYLGSSLSRILSGSLPEGKKES